LELYPKILKSQYKMTDYRYKMRDIRRRFEKTENGLNKAIRGNQPFQPSFCLLYIEYIDF
jgi:hypothetical protein